MSAPLAPCPCGQVPTHLDTIGTEKRPKYAFVTGDCCNGWLIEFRNEHMPFDSPECMARATAAWNEAPRAVAGSVGEAP